ncbi:hypothetical protein H0H93_007443 [Arthromyces matolae]|nr:hypothetical protein H0H93_007443 [Arthromyces matolae]
MSTTAVLSQSLQSVDVKNLQAKQLRPADVGRILQRLVGYDLLADYSAMNGLNRLAIGELEHAMQTELQNRKLVSQELEKKLRMTSTFVELMFKDCTFAEKVNIALYSWSIFYVDDVSPKTPQAFLEFQGRFLRNEPQIDPVLDMLADVMHKMYDQYPPLFTHFFITSTLDYITISCVEPGLDARNSRARAETEAHANGAQGPGKSCTNDATADSKRFAGFLRDQSGLGVATSVLAYPHSLTMDFTTFFVALPDMNFWFSACNDVLSFYKEELIGETTNYISVRAKGENRRGVEVLESLVEEMIGASKGVQEVLKESDSRALDTWKTFEAGYIRVIKDRVTSLNNSCPKLPTDVEPSVAIAAECSSCLSRAAGTWNHNKLALNTLPDYWHLSGVPLPKPLWDFDVKTAKPRPYRPFRWGYHQTMSLKKFEPDFWLELESSYSERLKQRKELYAKYRERILDVLPGKATCDACVELAEMVIQFLCARYPGKFTFVAESGVFWNGILDIEVDTRRWRSPGSHSVDAGEQGKLGDRNVGIMALEFLLDHVPEDFLVMEKNQETDKYELRAGIACSAIGWTISDKIGKPLKDIHGPVPDYKERMEFSMDRFFSKMACDKPIQRGSWSLEIGELLFMPPDDENHLQQRLSQSANLEVEDIFLRVDWQLLRRLPVSQAIVFNYKALFTPLEGLRNEPYVPKLMARVLREGKEEILKYKGTWHVEHKVLPALDKWSEEQEEKGWVPKGWNVRTLDEDPFYPGWDQ